MKTRSVYAIKSESELNARLHEIRELLLTTIEKIDELPDLRESLLAEIGAVDDDHSTAYVVDDCIGARWVLVQLEGWLDSCTVPTPTQRERMIREALAEYEEARKPARVPKRPR